MALNDKIRRLTNNVHLGGTIVEITNYREGTFGANNVPYLAFRGRIQCAETPDYTFRFETFVSSKKADGTPSKNFSKVKDWVDNVIPMTDPKVVHGEVEATKVDMVGSLSDYAYVNKEGKLVESTRNNMTFFNDFKGYFADVDVEGYIQSITDETVGSDEISTGRQKMRLITRDYRSMISLNNVIIPEEFVDVMKDNDYEKGATTLFYLTYKAGTSGPVKSGGIGVQRNNGGARMELTVAGAEPVYDPDSNLALDTDTIKAAMKEYAANHKKIEEEGYKGGSSGATSSGNRNGFANARKESSKPATSQFEDDDMPF